MFDRDYIGHWDLNGKDVTVTIENVKAGELTAQGGRKSKKPIVHFEGRQKGLACNKTNAKAIAAMYGNDTTKWLGKSITLYPTTTQFGSETVECIRVRPTIPGKARGRAAATPEPEAEAVPSALEQGVCPECDGKGGDCPACFGNGAVP